MGINLRKANETSEQQSDAPQTATSIGLEEQTDNNINDAEQDTAKQKTFTIRNEGLNILFISVCLLVVCFLSPVAYNMADVIKKEFSGAYLLISTAMFTLGIMLLSAFACKDVDNGFGGCVSGLSLFFPYIFSCHILDDDVYYFFYISIITLVCGLVYMITSNYKIHRFLFLPCFVLLILSFYIGFARTYGIDVVNCVVFPSVLSYFIVGLYLFALNRFLNDFVVLFITIITEMFLISYYGLEGGRLLWTVYICAVFYVSYYSYEVLNDIIFMNEEAESLTVVFVRYLFAVIFTFVGFEGCCICIWIAFYECDGSICPVHGLHYQEVGYHILVGIGLLIVLYVSSTLGLKNFTNDRRSK